MLTSRDARGKGVNHANPAPGYLPILPLCLALAQLPEGEVMAKELDITVSASLGVDGRKAMRAIEKIAEVMADMAEDFPYRADVRQALKASRYLMRHLTVVVDDESIEDQLNQIEGSDT